MNTKLHAVTDASGRPIRFFITAGQVSDYTGATALLSGLPDAQWLLADRGYDADWFRDALTDRGTRPCIPGRKSRKKIVRYDRRRYKRRNRIERMFGRLKDWRRVATRYDRCPKVFLPAISLAATVIFWLCVLNLKSTGEIYRFPELTSPLTASNSNSTFFPGATVVMLRVHNFYVELLQSPSQNLMSISPNVVNWVTTQIQTLPLSFQMAETFCDKYAVAFPQLRLPLSERLFEGLAHLSGEFGIEPDWHQVLESA